MKHIKLVVAAGITIAFAVGHLTAQPARLTAPPPTPMADPAKEAFKSDLAAAVKANYHTKVLSLLDRAAGDAKLTDGLVEKTWDFAYNVSAGKVEPSADRRDVLQATFLMKQQQKQIELLEKILAEMKKSNANKPQ